MPRCLLALSLVFVSFHANAFFTANTDKPDPYARRHYTAADLPAAKRNLAAKKAAAKKVAKTPADDEIAAEIAREDAGKVVAPPKPKAPVKPEPTLDLVVEPGVSIVTPKTPAPTEYKVNDRAPDEFSAPAIKAPKNGYPSIVVCRFSMIGKKSRGPSTIASRYLISDSDGFEACSSHGGEVTAGNDDDRSLMNVKDSAILKRAKK